MDYISKYTDEMDIHIEEYRNTILVQQKWRYIYFKDQDVPFWTYLEKKQFHNQADKLIWSIWGNYFKLKVRGKSEFAQRNQNKIFTVNFDIKWVVDGEHWVVNATKRLKSEQYPSRVNWNERKLYISTQDVDLRKINAFDDPNYQYTVTHEFGHMIGNVAIVNHWDEYREESKYYHDTKSIMHVGNSLRDRHLDYVKCVLNFMIPDTEFYLY